MSGVKQLLHLHIEVKVVGMSVIGLRGDKFA